MNIIFLDFDGVLNSTSSSFLNYLNNSGSGFGFLAAAPNPVSVKLLDHLINLSDAHLVISSSWRQGKTVDQLKYILSTEFTLKNYNKVIDKTRTTDIGECRGDQIESYLNANKDKITNYIIIDDDCDMLDHHRMNFVNTNTDVGFGVHDFKRACMIFNIDYNRKNKGLV